MGDQKKGSAGQAETPRGGLYRETTQEDRDGHELLPNRQRLMPGLRSLRPGVPTRSPRSPWRHCRAEYAALPGVRRLHRDLPGRRDLAGRPSTHGTGRRIAATGSEERWVRGYPILASGQDYGPPNSLAPGQLRRIPCSGCTQSSDQCRWSVVEQVGGSRRGRHPCVPVRWAWHPTTAAESWATARLDPGPPAFDQRCRL